MCVFARVRVGVYLCVCVWERVGVSVCACVGGGGVYEGEARAHVCECACCVSVRALMSLYRLLTTNTNSVESSYFSAPPTEHRPYFPLANCSSCFADVSYSNGYFGSETCGFS